MLQIAVISASIVVILAGLKLGQAIVSPLLLAGFFAILLAPAITRLRRMGIPNPVVLVLMLFCIVGLIVIFAVLIRTSFDQFMIKYPAYEEGFKTQVAHLIQYLSSLGLPEIDESASNAFDFRAVMANVGAVVKRLGDVIGQLFLILLVLAFMLSEVDSFSKKFEAMTDLPKTASDLIKRNFAEVRHYMLLKTAMSLLTGGLIGLWAWLIGLDNALFLGLLAFFLNFIPTIGSFVAALPGVALAFVLLGFPSAVIVAVGYLVINVAVSNVIEPWLMGGSLGISALLIIVGLVFWGWLLGAIGVILSVPLTLTVKALLESHSSTRALAQFFTPGVPDLDAEER